MFMKFWEDHFDTSQPWQCRWLDDHASPLRARHNHMVTLGSFELQKKNGLTKSMKSWLLNRDPMLVMVYCNPHITG